MVLLDPLEPRRLGTRRLNFVVPRLCSIERSGSGWYSCSCLLIEKLAPCDQSSRRKPDSKWGSESVRGEWEIDSVDCGTRTRSGMLS